MGLAKLWPIRNFQVYGVGVVLENNPLNEISFDFEASMSLSSHNLFIATKSSHSKSDSHGS